MERIRSIAIVLMFMVSVSEAADTPPKPSRSNLGDAAATVVSAEEGKITVKYSVLVPSGNSGGGRGRSRRPSVKAEEKEETLDVASDVTVKDSLAKDGVGTMSSIAEGATVKLHLAKETTRVPGEKSTSRVVVTKIEVIHPKMKK